MGIADLWPIVSLACDERVPFPVFLSHFINEHARPPRLAIDAYMFMFWSQLPDAEDATSHRRIIRNFMAKLWYLVRNNVLFVVVFDGKYKPGKLRHGHIPHISNSVSYDEVLRYFRTIPSSDYSESLSLVEQIKDILQRNCIDFVQAPAEAEAECAWLQRLGIVDYVVSDDSDTLVFGASQMLRMFNRVKYFDEDNKPVLSSTDYYVTPVNMDHITERTGLSKERLLLVAVLRGGDYSSGTEGIGITRAKEIALCGTTLLQDSPRKKTQDFGALPDFSQMLTEALVDLDKMLAHLPDPYYALKSELDRAEALLAFNTFLDDYLRKLAKNIFGRMATMKSKVYVDDYYALLYFFPLINHRLFKFTPYSVSFGELRAIQADLFVNVDCEVKRVNYNCSATLIGILRVYNGKQSFLGTGRAQNLQKESFALPRERKLNLKAFVVKLLAEKQYHEHIELVRTKLLHTTLIAVLHFNSQKLNSAVYFTKGKCGTEIDVDQFSDEEILESKTTLPAVDSTDEKRMSVEVPLNVVRLVAPTFVSEFERLASPKKSPKKKPPPQKTTLDLIWPGMLPTKSSNIPSTKIKKSNSFSAIPASDIPSFVSSKASPTKQQSPLKGHTSPTKNGRRSKDILLPGQTKVTSFFRPKGLENPFLQNLFVVSDDDSDGETKSSHKEAHDFIHMKNVLSRNPVQLKPRETTKMPIYSRVSSPELSPTKKIRSGLGSADFSPVKSTTEPQDYFPPV